MKKIHTIFAALLICLLVVGCGVVPAESIPPVPAETEAPTAAPATEPTQSVVPVTEPGTVVASAIVRFEYGSEVKEAPLEVFECRMHTLDNGYTRFEVDLDTCQGLRPIAFAYVGESHQPAFWYESDILTTQGRQTLVFEMDTGILEQSNGPDVHLQNRTYESVAYVLIYPD